jgi:hypothetical protein
MEREVPMTMIVFSRNEYGAYRATPGNAIVSRHDPTLSLLNLTSRTIKVTVSGLPGEVVVPAEPRPVDLPIGALPIGQYFYRAAVEGTDFIVQGGSGPGIIITP